MRYSGKSIHIFSEQIYSDLDSREAIYLNSKTKKEQSLFKAKNLKCEPCFVGQKDKSYILYYTFLKYRRQNKKIVQGKLNNYGIKCSILNRIHIGPQTIALN